MKQKKYIVITTIALTIILLATSIVNIAAVSNAKAFISQNPVVDIVASIVMLLIALILNLSTFFSRYTMGENSLKCSFALIFKLYEIEYKNILLIRQNAEKTILLIYVNCVDNNYDVIDEKSNIKANIYSINIYPKHMNAFIEELKSHGNIIFEIM